MDIIHKFIPKNPINNDTMNRITERAKDVLKVFGDNYIKQTPLMIVKNKEIDYEIKERRKEIVRKDKEKKKDIIKKNLEKIQMFQISQKFLKKALPLNKRQNIAKKC